MTKASEYNADRVHVADLRAHGNSDGLVLVITDPARHEHARMQAVRGLAALDTADARARLVDVAEQVDGKLRAFAVGAMARLEDAQLAPALGRWLDDPDPLVAAWAAEGLGRTRVQGAVPALIASLTHADWEVRGAAARALGRIGDRSGRQPVVELRRRELPRHWLFLSRVIWRLGRSRGRG
jgi:bilin biosynthesis protein